MGGTAVADPTPAITVTPSTGLVDGQVVAVDGTGWPPGQVGLYQCHNSVIPGSPTNEHPCEAPRVITGADVLGQFSESFTIRQYVIASNDGNSLWDCAVAPGCLVVAFNGATATASPIQVDPTVAPPASISGTVRDGFGVPFSNVGAFACPGTAPAVYGCAEMVFSFGMSTYTLNGLAPNAPYSIVGIAQVLNAYFGAPPVAITTPGSGETTTEVDFVFDSTLSGTVTGPDGITPVAGAQVNLVQNVGGGQIATTDAAGHFAVPAIPAGTHTIEVVPSAASGLGRASRAVAVGPDSDVTVEFQLRLGVVIDATILDGGAPASSAGVGACPAPGSGPNCPGLSIEFADGAGHATLGGLAPGTYNVGGFSTAGGPLALTGSVQVTGAGGDVITCQFTFNPSGAECSGGSTDVDGVSDAVEDGAPNGGDGNNDGTPDSQQPNVASLPNAVTGGYLTLASPGTTTLVNVASSPVPAGAPPLPPGTSAPVGVINFVVRGVPSGGTVDVALFLPPGTAPTGYLKLHANVWTDFTSNATIAGDVVTLHLTDGGVGDADGVANGEIVDPGAPIRTARPVAQSKDDCKKDGWRTLVDDQGRPFANQGDCVSYVATKGKNKAKG